MHDKNPNFQIVFGKRIKDTEGLRNRMASIKIRKVLNYEWDFYLNFVQFYE